MKKIPSKTKVSLRLNYDDFYYVLKILFKVSMYYEELNKLKHKEESLNKIPFVIIEEDGTEQKTGNDDTLTANNYIIYEEFMEIFYKFLQKDLDIKMGIKKREKNI